MSLKDQQEFQESGPAPGAEQTFADDPEMLELIRRGRERQAQPGPRRRPWWWIVVLVLAGLVGAGGASVPALLGMMPFNTVIPATGLFGGMMLALAALGHRPGNYEIQDGGGDTVEKAVLWKPLPPLMRLGALGLGLASPAVGLALALAQ